MYLHELSSKFNVPVRYIKEFFDKHGIPTLPYAHIDSKAINLFETNIDSIRNNIQSKNSPQEKIEGPKIIRKLDLDLEKYIAKTKPNARLLTVSRLLGIDKKIIIEYLMQQGSKRGDIMLAAPLSKEIFLLVKKQFDKGDILKEESYDFDHLHGIEMTDSTATFRRRERKSEFFGNKTYSEFKPILSIGKLLFFDYRKNKFGLIKEVKNANNFAPPKVFVYENGLSTGSLLSDEDIVAFTLTKDNNRYIATNLIKLSEVKFEEIDPFLPFISTKEITNVAGFPSGSSWQYIDDTTKSKMTNFFLKKNESDAFYYLLAMGNETDINTYINQHQSRLSDSEKLAYLKSAFSKKLFEITIIDWKSKDSKELLELAVLIDNKKETFILNQNILNCISEAPLTFDESWKMYSAFKDFRILQKVVETTSFQNSSSVSRLESVSEEILKNKHWHNLLKSKFEEEIQNLAVGRIIEIYQGMTVFSLITNEEQLMKLLEEKRFTIHEFEYLLSVLKTIPSKSNLKKLIVSVQKNLSAWKLNELIKTHAEQIDIATTLIDAFIELYPDAYEIDNLLSSIQALKESALLNYLLLKHYKSLASHDPLQLLKLAKQFKNAEAQKEGFAKIRIDSENKLNDLISELKTLKLSKAVLDSNKPLSAFISFVNAEGVPAVTTQLNSFINSHTGIVQCFLVKYLIYKLHKKKISIQELFALMNSIQWSEISAILVQAFVNANNHSEKFLLETLNEVFKKHFQILHSKNFTPISFQETFKIKNLVSKCNGRKHYDAELWKGKRWYYKGSITILNKGHVVEYCEGRPWKEEPLWNGSTNQPTDEHYKFYWCRGGYCAQRNDKLNLEKPFYEWTVIEISEVLNIKLEKLTISTLTGWINRMNEIVERLFCRSCNEVLRPYPFQPKKLGIYGVPMFQCVNNQCEMHEQPIRFTHCLNGKCHEILDSRDCQKCCNTGLICNHCGTMCPRCVGYDSGVIVQQTW